MEQLTGYQKSDVTSEILELAARFQSIASDNHLGHPWTQNTSLQKSANSHFKKPAPELSKGKTRLLAEMKMAKVDASRIKITAGLYLISKNKSGNEMMKKVMWSKLLKHVKCLKLYNVLHVYFLIEVQWINPDIQHTWWHIGGCTGVSSEKLPICQANSEVHLVYDYDWNNDAKFLFSGVLLISMLMRALQNTIALLITWLLIMWL